LYVATAANSRLTADFLDLSGIWKFHGPAGRERVVRLFSVVYPLLGLGLYYAYREPQFLVSVGGVAQALMLPLISGAALYLKQRDADRRVSPTFLSDILTWLAFFAISGVAIYSIVGLVVKPGGR